MTRRYVLLPALIATGSLFAQHGAQTFQRNHTVIPETRQQGLRDAGDTFFHEDFAFGLAGNTDLGAWTVAGDHGSLWVRSTTGPNGNYSDATERITSETFANGFMLLCGDSLNTTWVNGAPQEGGATGEVDIDAKLISPIFDLSDVPGLAITFQQRFRYCCNSNQPPYKIGISFDGGLTYPQEFNVTSGVGANVDNGTHAITIPIARYTNAAPALDQVRFRFNHEATASHYHWQVDDFKLIELHEFDLQMYEAWVSQDGAGHEYARIPSSALLSTAMIGGHVINAGYTAMTNVNVEVSVAGPTPFNFTITAPSIGVGDTLSLSTNHTLPSSMANGLYTLTYTVSADETDSELANNTITRWFEVNDSIYALDGLTRSKVNGDTDRPFTTISTRSFTNSTDNMQVGVYYQLNVPTTVYGIEVAILGSGNTHGATANLTLAGGSYATYLLDTVEVNFSGATPDVRGTPLAGTFSDLQTIDAAQSAACLIVEEFATPVNLPAGGYWAAIELFSNNGANHIMVYDDIRVPQPAIASIFWSPAQNRWFSNGNAAAIRVLTQPTGVGVQKLAELSGVSLYPNPTEGRFQLEVPAGEVFNVEVMDVTGKRVHHARTTGVRTDMDMSSFGKGVYMVRVSNDTHATVKRVVIQ